MRARTSFALMGLVATFVACATTEPTDSGGREDPGPSSSPEDAGASTTGADASVSPPDAGDDATNAMDASDGDVADAAVDAGPPRPDDGIKNGTETDVDCGGDDPATPRCDLYKTCLTTNDCVKGTCMQGPTAARCQLSPSCTGAPGTVTCGPNGTEDCCASIPLPEGDVQRLALYTNSDFHTVHVGPYRLDKYEVTVGRMRAFFEAMGGNVQANAPLPGAGAHPRIANSGWRSSFDVRLPSSWAEINARLGAAGCFIGGDNTDGGSATWTSTPGPYEELPIVCIDWYTLWAFCIWDGGRLPTDAEWTYAARGGDEGRTYAWGGNGMQLLWPRDADKLVSSLLSLDDNLYRFTVGTPFFTTDAQGHVIDGPAHMARPGSKTGNGRWGHADLTGNVLEYMLDVAPVPEQDCATDCANVSFPDPPQNQIGLYPRDWRYGDGDTAVWPDGTRSLRGGSWMFDHPQFNTYYYNYTLARTYSAAGGRCARD